MIKKTLRNCLGPNIVVGKRADSERNIFYFEITLSEKVGTSLYFSFRISRLLAFLDSTKKCIKKVKLCRSGHEHSKILRNQWHHSTTQKPLAVY